MKPQHFHLCIIIDCTNLFRETDDSSVAKHFLCPELFSHLNNFYATGVSSGPATMCDLDSNVTGEVGKVYYTGVEMLLVSFLYSII
jgi:hypothetical protein